MAACFFSSSVTSVFSRIGRVLWPIGLKTNVTRAGKVNLHRQRVGSGADQMDSGVCCPAICHTKPFL